MLSCREIIGRDYFESYSEFYLALCMAAEMGRREDKLDMSDMRVDKSILSKTELEYFKYLISIGDIYLGDGESAEMSVPDTKDMTYLMPSRSPSPSTAIPRS